MKTKIAKFNISEKYNGDHPIEENHHYENLLIKHLGEEGWEAQIVNVEIGERFIEIEYF